MAWIPITASIAGGAASGAAGGKKSRKGNKAADVQSRLAQQLFSETDPLRRSLIGRSENFLGTPSSSGAPTIQSGGGSGGIAGMVASAIRTGQANAAGGLTGGQPAAGPMGGDVMSTPTYLAYKDAADRNYGRARDNAVSKLPAGGALLESLVDLEDSRASTLTQGAGQIYSDELARALSLATGTAPTALNSLGQAAAVQAANANTAAQANSQKSGAVGEGLGTYLGGKNDKPAAATGQKY